MTGPLRVGDRVFGIVGGGGMAEYVVSHERMVVPIPADLDFEAAAAVPEVFLTALDALEPGEGQPGERVLIHAVGGGVGSAAVQVAHAMGCTVLGTSRTAEKLERVAELGLDVGIDTTRRTSRPSPASATGGRGVDVVIDHLGASGPGGQPRGLAPLGRLVLVGLLGGSHGDGRPRRAAPEADHDRRDHAPGPPARGEDRRDPAVRERVLPWSRTGASARSSTGSSPLRTSARPRSG